MDSIFFLLIVVVSEIFFPQRDEYDDSGSYDEKSVFHREASSHGNQRPA